MVDRDRVPLFDPRPEINLLWDELMGSIGSVISSGRFILGPNVGAFEEEVAAYLGARYAVGLNSGTDALVIGLRALGIGPGHEVITTPFTMFATAEAIHLVGAEPVFADIDPATLNLDPRAVAAAVTPRTAAIVPVHLFGLAADMDALCDIAVRHSLAVLEDTAQAMGGSWRNRKLGTIGEGGAFSFFPSKNLGGFGDGGLFVTGDPEVAAMARALRTHGSHIKYHNEVFGYNSRLDEIQAAILRVKLPHLDDFNSGRQAAANRYDALIGDHPDIVLPARVEGAEHVFHQYTIRVNNGRRDHAREVLAEAGINSMVYYPIAVNELPVFADEESKTDRARAASQEVLSLPIWPHIEEALQERIAQAFLMAVG